jgi:multidrug efflux system membrane fusion protein
MAARRFPWKWLVILALLGLGAVYGPKLIGGKGGAPSGMAAMMGGPPPVSVATVISKPVMQWANFSGVLEAVNAVEVRPRVAGQITAIHFADGAQVKKGQPLFTIDPRPFEAAMISAKASLAEAQSVLARAKKLVGSKAISRAEFEAAQAAYDRALGNHKTAAVNLDYTRITAPISGKISRAEITRGNLVDPAMANAMANIVDLSPIYASFELDEQTFLKTIQGVSAEKLKTIPIEVAFGNAGENYTKATVHSFDNQIMPASGTIRVRATLENADATLVPGLFARVRIGSADVADAVLIHPTAVGTDQSKKFVMVVDDKNVAQYREVTLAGVEDGLQIIASGLNAGERIIVNGLQRAQPGTPVTPEAADMQTLAPLNAPEAEQPAAHEAPKVE